MSVQVASARTTAPPPRADADIRPFGVLWLQLLAFNLLAFLALIGRKLQGGDKPIAPLLRLLYATAILAALAFVIRAFVRDRRRLVLWVLRVVARARRRPMLALYLAFWLVVGLSYAVSVTIPAMGEGIDTLWSGGKRDVASFAGDNSQSVVELLFMLLFTTDIAALAAALAWLAWGPDTRARRTRCRARTPS